MASPPGGVMDMLFNAVRSRVSADKNRYHEGSFNLDLTYITDRVIAMSFPAEGVESTYRNFIDDVATMLTQTHSDHYMVYNLSERMYNYSKFHSQVQDWCGFPDHHAPPLELMFSSVKSIYSWLKADPKNVAVVHCLAGKGRTGTIICALLLYCGLFYNAEDSLNFFAFKRSKNTWGVTSPSQIRYVHYFADILYKNVTPVNQTLEIDYIFISNMPSFTNSPGTLGYTFGRQGGACPLIEIYDVTNTKNKKSIFTSESLNQEMKYYTTGSPAVFKLNDCKIHGDILIEVNHVTSFFRIDKMLRFQFSTCMINGRILRLHRFDLDLACEDKRFSPDFFIELGFVQSDELRKKEERQWWENSPKGDGSLCFWDEKGLNEAKLFHEEKKAKVEKGGWLTKRGHTVRNWKRRWFVLKDGVLAYFKSPRDVTPQGYILLEDILTIVTQEKVSKDTQPSEPLFNWFEIVTKKNNYLICAESEQEMRDWVDSIEFLIRQLPTYSLRASQNENVFNPQTMPIPPDFSVSVDITRAINQQQTQTPTSSQRNSLRNSLVSPLDLEQFRNQQIQQHQQQQLQKQEISQQNFEQFRNQQINQQQTQSETEEELKANQQEIREESKEQQPKRISPSIHFLHPEQIELGNDPLLQSIPKEIAKREHLIPTDENENSLTTNDQNEIPSKEHSIQTKLNDSKEIDSKEIEQWVEVNKENDDSEMVQLIPPPQNELEISNDWSDLNGNSVQIKESQNNQQEKKTIEEQEEY